MEPRSINGDRLRVWAALLAALVLTVTVLAGTGKVGAASLTVHITDHLDPADVTVARNTTVTFVNDHAERHRIRTTAGPSEFDTGNLEPGESFNVTLTADGTYQYRDERNTGNPAYFGRIVVVDSVATTTINPQTPPPATVPPSPPPAPTTVTVSIGDRVFIPLAVTVSAGGTVTWINNDSRPHTVTASDRSFDSGIIAVGASWSRTFPNGGSFAYFCELHPDMTGTVIVTASGGGGGAPPPTTAPPPPTTAPPSLPPPTTAPATTIPGNGAGGSAAPTNAAVTITGNQFSPRTLTIAAGGTVSWRNLDSVPHTVTATDSSFDSGILRQGDEFAQSFPIAGTYSYVCELHPGMSATIIVTAPGSSPPAPSTPPPTSPAGGATAQTGSAGQGGSAGSAGAIDVNTGNGPTSANGASTTGTVAISGNQYSPRTITIAVGGTVTWVNRDAVPHTVTASGRSFDSGLLRQGDRWSRTFTTAGTYSYFCELHPEMSGTVVVTAPGSAAPPFDATANTTGGTARFPTADASSSDNGSASTAPGAADRSTVTMDAGQFQPAMVTVADGGTVTWTNTDSVPHTVTADDGSFDSGILMPGDTFSRRFTTVGEIGYHCILHPGMIGSIHVATAAAESNALADPDTNQEADDSGAAPASGAAAAGTVDQVVGGPPESAAATIEVTDAGFEPAALVVRPGETVRWVLTGVLPHTVTADDGSFDSGILNPGDTFSMRFDEVGSYTYTCILHPTMIGTITVAPPPEATAGGSSSRSIVPLLFVGVFAGVAIAMVAGFIFAIARQAARLPTTG